MLPAWIGAAIDTGRTYQGEEAQIGLAIDLARLNVDHATGGPFGAAIFNTAGHVVSLGVNRVEPLATSLAHAEIIALVGAQRTLGHPRINHDGTRYTLATSAQPCCQCYGAIVWAGIDALLIGARSSDTESLTGFDEGPLPIDWIGELRRREIHVSRDLHRDEACTVLRAYAAAGGTLY